MASYFGISSDSVSTLFSGLGSMGKASQNINDTQLSTYSSIRNGSYYKLVKSYYEKTDNGKANASTAISGDTVKELTGIKNDAEDLKDSTEMLLAKGSNSVFSKKKITNEDGTVSSGYDTEKIYKALNNFVGDYNAVIHSTKDVNATSILTPASGMVKTTNANESLLSKMGITIKENNTLEIDEEVFKAADMANVKSLFNGTGSYAYYIEARVYGISQGATSEASKSSTYTNKGAYSYNYSSAFDDFF